MTRIRIDKQTGRTAAATGIREVPAADRFPAGRRRILRQGSAALAAGLLVAATAFAVSSAAPEARSAAPAAPASSDSDPALAAFVERFALNALLIPLLEADEHPARWADPEFTMPCEAVEVTVDGHAVATGEELTGQAFSVRWHLRDCLPFGVDGPRLTGRAELAVYPGDDGYGAQVRLRDLHVEQNGRVAVLDETFSATAR